MARFIDDQPPEWLRPYMGPTWRPWTLQQWYDALVKAGLL